MDRFTAHLTEAVRTRAEIEGICWKITNLETLQMILAVVQAAYEKDPEPRPRNEDSLDIWAGLAAHCAYRVKDQASLRKAALLLANEYDKELSAANK